MPVHSVRELIDIVKANPQKYSFSSPGFGTPSHLLDEQFRVVLGLDMVHVPYAGAAPAISATVSGHTPISFASTTAAAPQAAAGNLRVLAILSPRQSPSMPQVPTIGAAGYPDLDGDGWVGALVPSSTPRDIVTLLSKQIDVILALPDIRAKLLSLGLDSIGGLPEDFARQLRAEGEKWSRVIAAAKIRAP